MPEVSANLYQKNKKLPFHLSAAFLIFVCLITAGLFAYNMQLESKIEDIESQITQKQNSIADLRKNPDIEIYSIYESNANVFNELDNRSQVPLFISHLKKNFQKFGLEMGSMRYDAGVVEVEVKTETNNNKYAYQKVLQFMKGYREDEKALFDFEQITEISGYDKIVYNATFTLK